MAASTPPMSPQSQRSNRPPMVSSMSHASIHSHRSSKSREERKAELTESPKDKRRLEGKSDPTKALSEAQPAAVALEDSNLENLRQMRHKDKEGNVITDPDRSNPTRPRMERPLDTIRSFNAAAEGTTYRRSSYQRQPSNVGWESQQRRGSYYGAQNTPLSPNARPGPGPRPFTSQSGYYRNNSYGYRPEIQEEGYAPAQGPPRQQPRYAPNGAPYGMHTGESSHSIHSHQQSYETMTSGSDEMSKSTNPSSQNSSFDQIHQVKQNGGYETNPYRQFGPPLRNHYPPSAMPNGYGRPHQEPVATDDYGIEFTAKPPPPPPKSFRPVVRETQMPPSAMMNGGGRLQKIASNNSQREAPKRQSWIKRTFSKRA